ncbi:hypothetical protein [Methylobacter sp. BlB1]|jgi:hypothetical protein|uniref:hypothetical protein n=1 Tax=Methylobacter sp. BlB1 TaxID=2785914 RepID=UPI0018954A18|nr:hypothetical protein [Methylobacter sp. BlB1]MBF6649779.1 hypothetical protein [Methylobacter sp. BlB1]
MMTMRWYKLMVIVLLIGAVFLLAGCATTDPAFYRAAEFKPEFIDQITLLPAVDARTDKAAAVNLEDWLRVEAATNLRKKGYAVLLSAMARGTPELTYDTLRAADLALIKRLGPPGERWIMILALVDLNVAGSRGKVEAAGFLYDKEKGTLLWRDTSICLVGQGDWIFGTLTSEVRGKRVISEAAHCLLASIPTRGP